MFENKITNAVAIFATIIGVLKPFGLISRIFILTELVQTLAISPAPAPYSTFARGGGVMFGCEDSAGQVSWHQWDYVVRSAFGGPYRRVTPLLLYFSSEDKLIEPRAPDQRWDLMTQYYFCKDGPIAVAAGCAPNLAAIRFKHPENPLAPKSPVRRVACLR